MRTLILVTLLLSAVPLADAETGQSCGETWPARIGLTAIAVDGASMTGGSQDPALVLRPSLTLGAKESTDQSGNIKIAGPVPERICGRCDRVLLCCCNAVGCACAPPDSGLCRGAW